jgi:hypothetical protein
VGPICAFMWMSSRVSDTDGHSLSMFGRPPVPELAKLSFYPHCPASGVKDFSDPEPASQAEPDNKPIGAGESVAPITDSKDCSLSTSSCYAYKDHFGSLGPSAQHEPTASAHSTAEKPRKPSVSPLEGDEPPTRWKLAVDAIEMYLAIRNHLRMNTDSARCPRYRLETEELLYYRAGNWPSNGLLNSFRGVLMGMALWFASME